jgi:hypothetical protein
MTLTLSLSDGGRQIVALNVPLPRDYYLLTEKYVSERLILPYLESLNVDSLALTQAKNEEGGYAAS